MRRSARQVTVLNCNHPGQTRRVDAAMYNAMEWALLAVVPSGPPGMTLAALRGPVIARLPSQLYPGGEKAGWWLKTVQLDLEARGKLTRTRGSPLRLYRTNPDVSPE